MLKRKFYDVLLNWRKNKKKECLLIKGARQVGKTFIVREFGKNEYESFIEINFYTNPDLKNIFDGSIDSKEIIKRITAYIPNASIIPNKTLLFLDEIQRCSKARTALKFLAEYESIDVIASGSLLGLSYGQESDKEVEQIDSIPVGYEKQIIMYPLDLEEYLWAKGYNSEAINYLKDKYINKSIIDLNINNKYRELVKEFIIVGGMPEVVNDFINNNDCHRVQELQEKILNSYNDDILNHARSIEKVKVSNCFNSIPSQLAKENKKFKFSEVEKGGSSRKYLNSINWLIDSNLAYSCKNINNPILPLNAYTINNEFKIYLHDTGLLMAMYGFATKKSFLDNSLKGFTKGGIYENFIATELIKKGYKIYYYKYRDETEIEFVIEYKDSVVPIEVKSSNNPTKSLNKFIEEFNPSIAFKFANSNIGLIDYKLTLSHYMIMFL